MKKFIKLVCTTMCLLMISTMGVSASVNDREVNNKVILAEAEIENPEESTLVSRDTYYINCTRSGSSALDQTFTAKAEEGKTLNIWCDNNSVSKGTVYFSVEVNGSSDGNILALKPGEGKTRKFTMPSGAGVAGSFRVYIYTKDGSKMDIDVSARQF